MKPVGYLSVVFRETGITHAKLRLNYGTQLEGWVIMKGNDPEGQHDSWAKLQTRTSPICKIKLEISEKIKALGRG